jgi:ligand-binding sensor domain-containing protein
MTIKLTIFTFFNALVLLTSCNGQITKLQVKTDNIVKGDTVTELGNNIMVIHQDKKNIYWFGSWETGVYRFDGKTFINFTTKYGLSYPSQQLPI